MRSQFVLLLFIVTAGSLSADDLRVFADGEFPDDARLKELRTLNNYFPFKSVDSVEQWKTRQAEIKRRILISQGLWPEPTKTDLNAVVHGLVDHDDYTVERVFFESIPGHFVTGSLYRPKGKSGPFPAVLCPHGHWRDARFYDAGEGTAKKYIASGAERFINAARNHIQARCVQLARMGCVAFFYDMTGNCDSIQFGHRPDKSDHLDTKDNWGFFSVQAGLRLQNMMGLQTWNSVRSIDFLLEQQDVDPKRIGVTGASGGGTQSMIIAAIDDRITAAMPCVMVSTSMQGGCSCENAPLMRIDQGNIDIAAAIAPRPLALTAADDWTRELESKGYPALQKLYTMLGVKERLTSVFHIHFPHNYNHVNRTVMYSFFNRHFKLGLEEPVLERDFELLSKEQLTVWNENHPAPSGSDLGDPHEITLLGMATEDSEERVSSFIPDSAAQLKDFNETIGAAWETMIGRRLDQVGEVKFSETKQAMLDGVSLKLGRLDHTNAEEQIPVSQLSSSNENQKGVVVWITESGKSGLTSNGKVIAPVADLIRKGYTVISGDLSGQGEFLPNDEAVKAQRMWYQRSGKNTWERYPGFTYGYNHSLFAQRTHDILTLIKFASTLRNGPVHVVGLDSTAGPLVLAARSQAGSLVAETIVDVGGFRFEEITARDDPMFLSGSVKYLDIDGLLGVCAPHKVVVAGMNDDKIGGRVYSAANAAEKLRFVDRKTLDTVIQSL